MMSCSLPAIVREKSRKYLLSSISTAPPPGEEEGGGGGGRGGRGREGRGRGGRGGEEEGERGRGREREKERVIYMLVFLLPATTASFFIVLLTIMIASWSDLSVSSMNCSAPPLNMNVHVLASGQPLNKLYLQDKKEQTNVCIVF